MSNTDIYVQKSQSFSGIVETYKAIAFRIGGKKHTEIMGNVIDAYMEGIDGVNKYSNIANHLGEPLTKGYVRPGKFITCKVKPSTIKNVRIMAKGNISSFITHRLLRYLELNNLDANNPPTINDSIVLKHRID